MSVSGKRVRSESAVEERLIDSFVESCTSKFASNVSFADSSATIETLNQLIVLIGTRSQLSDSTAMQKLPFFGLPHVQDSISSASEGKLYGQNLEGPKGGRILIGVVPETASRCNSAARPDVITSLVAEAAREAAGTTKTIDIFVRSDQYLCVAVAVSKAFHSFTARGGASANSFNAKIPQVRVFFPNPAALASSMIKSKLDAAVKYVQLCMRLVDAPTNLLDTITFAEIAEFYAKSVGASIDIIRGEELRERGYGGVYGVGKGAEYPPALVTLHYKPSSGGISPQQKIALVGKGIVYDTGGLALKTPASNMCNMKTDMGGAAAVLCGFLAAASQRVNQELSVTLCLADNAVGPRSFRNDDILLLKSGLTIEINNTDAEGRLVLADGVFHAANLQSGFVPDIVMDMATLTGAQLIATGKRHAALYVDDEATEALVVAAGKATGDTCFPVVYCPEYHNPEFSSKVADYRNLMAQTNNAGISCAGQFIANNLTKSYKGKYVHVDLAGPSSDANGGTGFGVALFLGFIGYL